MSAYGLARNWWLILLRGLFAVLFVLAAFFGTYLTLVALVLLFGAYALADGILGVIAGLRGCLLKRELPHIRRSKSLPTTKCGDKRPFKKQPLTRHTGSRPWWLLLIEGLIGIVAGVLSFLSPGLTALTLLYLIVAWAIVTGTLEIVAAIRLRRRDVSDMAQGDRSRLDLADRGVCPGLRSPADEAGFSVEELARKVVEPNGPCSLSGLA